MLERLSTRDKLDADQGDLRGSVVEILDPNGNCAGTGFLLDGGLVVACAHVVVAGRPKTGPPTEPIVVRFAHVHSGERSAQVIPQWWHDTDQGDVAVLRLVDLPPASSVPLRLAEHAISGRRV